MATETPGRKQETLATNNDRIEVNLKLLIDKRAGKVLYAEVGKDFVDFLYHIFSLPLGAVVGLLTNEGITMPGCIAKLKASFEDLSETYLLPNLKRDFIHGGLTFTAPNISNPRANLLLLPHNDDDDHIAETTYGTSKTLYCCSKEPSTYISNTSTCIKKKKRTYTSNERETRIMSFPCRLYATEYQDATCCGCYGPMNKEMISVVPAHEILAKTEARKKAIALKKAAKEEGYVKGGLETYMVTDDLVVKPMSAAPSIIDLLRDLKLIDLGDVEEKIVSFGKDEALKLLKASMVSDEVLTSVYPVEMI